MICPACGSAAHEVKDSRPNAEENAIRRRRRCGCGHRFTTFEVLREDPELIGPNDRSKWRRAAEMQALFRKLDLEDAHLALALVRRLSGAEASEQDREAA